MVNKMNNTDKTGKILRVVYGIMSVLMLGEGLYTWKLMEKFTFEPWLIPMEMTASLMCAVVAICYNMKWFDRAVSFLVRWIPIILSAYLILSGISLFLMNAGWNGCAYWSEPMRDCGMRLELTWRFFPITTPHFDINYLWGRGFSGGSELGFALGTALSSLGIALGMTMSNNNKTVIRPLLTSAILLSASMSMFYCIYTLLHPMAWPGIAYSVLLLGLFLMLDWKYSKPNSSESEEKKDVVTEK